MPVIICYFCYYFVDNLHRWFGGLHDGIGIFNLNSIIFTTFSCEKYILLNSMSSICILIERRSNIPNHWGRLGCFPPWSFFFCYCGSLLRWQGWNKLRWWCSIEATALITIWRWVVAMAEEKFRERCARGCEKAAKYSESAALMDAKNWQNCFKKKNAVIITRYLCGSLTPRRHVDTLGCCRRGSMVAGRLEWDAGW